MRSMQLLAKKVSTLWHSTGKPLSGSSTLSWTASCIREPLPAASKMAVDECVVVILRGEIMSERAGQQPTSCSD